MITVSDNAATDVITWRLGKERINATVRALGLQRMVLRGTCAEIYAESLDDMALSLEELSSATLTLDMARLDACRHLRPELGNSATAEEVTRLLALIWLDEAAAPASCEAMRSIMYGQVWPQRLRSGFGDGVRIGAKTGSLFNVRNEAGVVELPDGGRCAVAVFTRAGDPRRHHPAADAAIGRAARLAVDHLRRDRASL